MSKAWPTLVGATALVAIALVLIFSAARAQGRLSLSWFTVDGGGGVSVEGKRYVLTGGIGQPDAGLLRGAGYTLSGGFWSGEQGEHKIHLPLVIREPTS